MNETVLVIGATSGIAQALCERLAARKCHLILTGRRTDELERLAQDLKVRHEIEAVVEPFDALDFAGHDDFISRCLNHFEGDLNGAVLCHGILPDQRETERCFEAARRSIDINFTSYVSLLHRLANYFQDRGSGYLAVISSVAGDRGRQSNYVYGASKAALTAFLQGLRNRLAPHGVNVLTIKPGPVKTPMIAGTTAEGGKLVATPEKVAADIDRAIQRGKHTLYTPWYWGGIMWAVCRIPESIFKRMKM